MIDSHAHLLPDFVDNIDELVENAQTAGLTAIVNSAIEPRHYKFAVELEEKYRGFIYTTLGFAPSWIKKLDFKKSYNYIRESTDYCAVGEVGLDYHWIRDDLWQRKQEEAFIKFIELGNEIEKPLVIHSRKAESACLDLLEDKAKVPVLLHCFAGNLEEARRIIDLNWLISIPTAVVNRKKHRKLARIVPLENIVVETDTPFLSPIQGHKNEPANVKYAIKEVAFLKEIAYSDVVRTTTKNAQTFYRI